MKRGGKRKPTQTKKKGSIDIPRLSDYYSANEVKRFARRMLKRSEKSDVIAKWVGDHLYQALPQPTQEFKGNLTISFDSAFRGTSPTTT